MDFKQCIASLVLIINIFFIISSISGSLSPVSASLFLIISLLASLHIINNNGRNPIQIVGLILIVILPLLLVFIPTSTEVAISMIAIIIINVILTLIGIYLLRK